MKITLKKNKKTYPYLAIWAGVDYDVNQFSNLKNKDILIISEGLTEKNEKGILVQNINGAVGYFTKNEQEYLPLPKGYKITIIQ